MVDYDNQLSKDDLLALERRTRGEVRRCVGRLGGWATSGDGGETGYVVAGPGAVSKLDEARERDVPVMDEEGPMAFARDGR